MWFVRAPLTSSKRQSLCLRKYYLAICSHSHFHRSLCFAEVSSAVVLGSTNTQTSFVILGDLSLLVLWRPRYDPLKIFGNISFLVESIYNITKDKNNLIKLSMTEGYLNSDCCCLRNFKSTYCMLIKNEVRIYRASRRLLSSIHHSDLAFWKYLNSILLITICLMSAW